jgi:hypothetical protein
MAHHLRIVGVLERRQPLPPGRYWITVTSSDSAPERMTHFLQWAESNAQTVIVDKREPLGGNVNGLFAIFTVLQPTTWDARQFGFPNVAGPEIQTSADTVQRPPVPTPGSVLSEFFGDFFGSPIGRFALVAGLVVLFTRSGDK